MDRLRKVVGNHIIEALAKNVVNEKIDSILTTLKISFRKEVARRYSQLKGYFSKNKAKQKTILQMLTDAKDRRRQQCSEKSTSDMKMQEKPNLSPSLSDILLESETLNNKRQDSKSSKETINKEKETNLKSEKEYTTQKNTSIDETNEKRLQLDISHWKNDYFSRGRNEGLIDENIEKLKRWRVERLARINVENSSLENMPENPILEAGRYIHEKLMETEWKYCSSCNENWLDVKISPRAKKCPRCLNNRSKNGVPPTFSPENNQHADESPDVLKSLNQVEQAAISRIAVVIKMYRLRGGSLFMKGHIIAFEQDLPEFALRRPPTPENLPMIVLIAPGQTVPSSVLRVIPVTSVTSPSSYSCSNPKRFLG